MEEKLKFAVFVDYDNIEIGVKSTLGRELEIECVLEGIKQRGEIVSKVAYGNWSRHFEATRAFTEHGVQMVQRDSTPRGDKNGADINLALDALEMAFTRDHINAFVIISGDSDFMALVNKLKQYNKRVYIVGGKQFTSTILQRNCHEFISYESVMDLLPSRSRRGGGGQRSRTPQPRSLPPSQALPLLDRALTALEVRGAQPQLGLLKSTMLQLDPAFTERDFGVSSFSTLIEKLQTEGHLRVRTVESHLVVERADGAEAPAPTQQPTREDALPELQDVLAANVDLLAIGIPEREVEAIMRAADPDFHEENFGFSEFGELLNFACDKGLLKIEADANETLRYYPGPDLLAEPAPRSPTAAAETEPAEDESRRPRRRRRRRGGRGRSGGVRAQSDESEAEAADGGDEAPPSASPEESARAFEDAEEREPKTEAKAARKKVVKKKAARKGASRKKAAKKKAVPAGD